MSHIEIIKNLWLGNQYSSSIFEGDSILSIGCNPKKTYTNQLKLSIIDSKDSDISTILQDAIEFINKELLLNHKILVHCSGGINRSPIIVIVYLVKYCLYNLQDAITLVKQKKTSIRIQPHYLRQIQEFLLV